MAKVRTSDLDALERVTTEGTGHAEAERPRGRRTSDNNNLIEINPEQLGTIINKAIQSTVEAHGEDIEEVERLDKDKGYQAEMRRMNEELESNRNLTQEVMAMLFDDELGYLWGSDTEHRYIDLEQEPIFNYDTLRRGGQSEPARVIKNHRNLQLMDFARQCSFKKSELETGFALVFKDNNYQPTKEEKINLDQMAMLMVEKFFFPPYGKEPDFPNFLKVCYEDFFDLDDISLFTRRTLDGTPLGFHLLDSKFVKPMIPTLNRANYQPSRWDNALYQEYYDDAFRKNVLTTPNPSDYDYIFEKKKRPYAKFTSDYMYKAHFFLTSDFRRVGRGRGIVEQGVRILTYILNAFTMNSSNFTINRTPQGLLALTGGTTNIVQLEKLKKLLATYHTGAQNRNRFPIVGLPEKGDAKWVPFRESSKDMEYHMWVTLMFSIFAQLSGTSPEEVSMGSHREAMKTGGLNKDNQERIMNESKDVGLRMFLKHIENIINRNSKDGVNVWEQIVKMPVKAKFVGTEMKNEKLSVELDKNRLATDTSINELLLREDKERQELIYGGHNLFDIPGIALPQIFTALNALAQQEFREKQAKAQQEAQAGAMAGQPKPEQMSAKDADIMQRYGQPQGQEGEEENVMQGEEVE